jgi:lipopolysaccharide transport system ATP-binding protein
MVVTFSNEIAKFSDRIKLLDPVVKPNSSLMQLIFVVVAHRDTKILFVNEVIAKWDVQFLKKCIGNMGEVATETFKNINFYL